MKPLLEELATLVAYDTRNPGGDEAPLIGYLEQELRERGGATTLGMAQTPGGPRHWVFAAFGAPRLLLNAHVDTVPTGSGWTGDPLLLRVVGRNDAQAARADAVGATATSPRAIGLGAADTKGAIAVILGALDEVRPANVGVLFSGDEEMASGCMRNALASGVLREAGITRALVCEPTGCRAGVRHRGILALEISLTGVGGHSSLADQMPAPVAELARVGAALHAWGVARRDVGPAGFTGMCMNVAAIEGGVAFNIVPPRAKLTLSVRPPPGSDVAAVRAELEAEVRRLTAGLDARDVHIEATVVNGAFATRDLDAFAPLGATAVDLGFWTEAALLAEAGIDAVVYGPGHIEQAHTADEWVAVEQLERARRGVCRLLGAT